MAQEYSTSKIGARIYTREIAKELQVHQSTISLDNQYWQIRARTEVKEFIEKLPLLILKSTAALNLISAETWKLVNSPESTTKDKISALALLKDVERQKVELFNSSNIVDALVGTAEKKQEEQTKEQEQGQQLEQDQEDDQEDNEEERQEE